ncbi:inositol monophosphatase family protein [Catenulispora yoronensis]|uniref:inositol-phosphate phosphatase n=1 Tax=Catenulispora yoronensis TaxID=450799 RepID=A0ABN2UA91_9ACTN
MTLIDMKAMVEVERIIRETAANEIVPRFRHLRPADIAEKGPNDPVTVADRAAEETLAKRLQAFVPGSVVVGEERVADDPTVMTLLDGPDPVWIIDPIDGTRNFVAGDPNFATLVTLAYGGRLVASWTYGPIVGVSATALTGQGAKSNGVPLRITPGPRSMHGLRVAAADEEWWPNADRHKYAGLCERGIAFAPLSACGLTYVEVAAQRLDAMILTWDLPWDHAAGLLLIAEAGGAVLTADSKPHVLANGNQLPFVAAGNYATAELLIKALA